MRGFRSGFFGATLLFLTGTLLSCGSGQQRLTLKATFLSTVPQGVNTSQFTCQTIVFPEGQEATNLLVLPTTHFIPVDVDNIPQNNFEIEILSGAIFESQEQVLTVQMTCTPSGEGFLGFNIFSFFLAEANFSPQGCSSQCDLNLELTNFLSQGFIDQLSCPSLNAVQGLIIIFGFCDPDVDPESLGCLALGFVDQTATQTGCALLGGNLDDLLGGGNGGGEETETDCANTLDDDGDETVDCEDSDCAEAPECLDPPPPV